MDDRVIYKTELQFQSACYLWFNNTYRTTNLLGRLRRIKNELDNHPRKTQTQRMTQLNENKCTGVIPGDSDFYWIDRRITFIELKLPSNTQSDDQHTFEDMVTACGHGYIVIKTMEAFQKLIIHLIYESEQQGTF